MSTSASPRTIQIPYNFKLRDYQKPLWNAVVAEGKSRACVVWHRRAGKDKTFINIMAAKALQRVGSYYYILPFYAQARKIVWEGFDANGFKNIEHFPPQLVKRKQNQEMVLELVNGSIIRFLGSDNIDSIVGTNPIGIVFSEFSVHKVEAWNFLRPILLENKGWAIFNGTPRGKNHLYKMFQAATPDPQWYTDKRTVDDTNIVSPSEIEDEIKNGMPRALAMQEFYCSFDATMTGAYYGEVIVAAQEDGRITQVPHDPDRPVFTAWDLGIDDSTVIWFMQSLNGHINVFDVLEGHGKGMDYYARNLLNRPYTYSYHAMPQDVQVREYSSGMTRKAMLQRLGLQRIKTAPRIPVEDGISATRAFIARCQFDETRCERAIEALKTYRCDYDTESESYGKPVHDWSSHYADALRYGAICWREAHDNAVQPSVATGADYDPLGRRDNGTAPNVYVHTAAAAANWN